MSRFAVGQRVKVIRDSSGYCPELIGVETFIAGPEKAYPCGWYNRMVTGYLIGFKPDPPWEYYVVKGDDMVPIVPDGMEAPEQTKELFEPEPELLALGAKMLAALLLPVLLAGCQARTNELTAPPQVKLEAQRGGMPETACLDHGGPVATAGHPLFPIGVLCADDTYVQL